ncbi:APC family permease [Nocardioides sp. J9]|uniref:APC family permease n=1 Tax=Nocardioides sp. J9 TaxID=935844 RepID=UPI0011A9FD26|nr:APC family permease [Nocardioides sp. J9]
MSGPTRRLPALARALDAPPEVPGVRSASDLDGLARRSVGQLDLLGTSVAVVAPTASALISPFLMLRVVGPGAWLSAVIGFTMAFLLVSTFSQFSQRVAASGSMYTWVTRSVGTRAGILVAAALLLGYGTLVTFGISQTVRHTAEASASAGAGTPSVPAQALLAVVVTAVCVAASVRGIGVATRIALAAEVLLVLALLVLVAVAMSRNGLSLGTLLSLDGADPLRVLLGASFIMSITVGLEVAASLAAEARRPFLGVPRAMGGTVAISAGLFALAYVAMHGIVVTEGPLTGPVRRWFPSAVDVGAAEAVLGSLLALSYFALALCALNALARIVLSLAREGLLPTALGRTHRTWRSPYAALLAIAPFALLPPVCSALAGERIGVFTGRLLGSAVLVLAVAYVVVALAVPVFLARLDELTWRPVAVAVAAALLTATVASVRVVDDLRQGTWLASAVTVAALAGAVLWHRWLQSHRRPALARMGIHDETIASDLLGQ